MLQYEIRLSSCSNRVIVDFAIGFLLWLQFASCRGYNYGLEIFWDSHLFDRNPHCSQIAIVLHPHLQMGLTPCYGVGFFGVML
jgi:hypothetical protein